MLRVVVKISVAQNPDVKTPEFKVQRLTPPGPINPDNNLGGVAKVLAQNRKVARNFFSYLCQLANRVPGLRDWPSDHQITATGFLCI